MIETLTIDWSPSGDQPPLQVPSAHFGISETVQFRVIGIDFNNTPVVFEDLNYQGQILKTTPMGKLSEQNAIFEQQVINSLVNEGWDFDAYPNPEIVFSSLEPLNN